MSYSIRQNPAYYDPNTGNYTKGRQGNTVDKIVIHHAATTNFDGIGATFQRVGGATSAHYGVGRNQNVDQYVSEDDIAWHAGNWAANCTSIGIENVDEDANWNIAPETFETLTELVRDIAKRHGLFPVQVGKTLFGHRDFSQTACPETLYARLQELANAVNDGSSSEPAPAPNQPDQVLHIGEKFVFPKHYRVDGLAQIGGVWQFQCNELCPVGFTWNDNGIPTDPVNEVAGGVGNTSDQVLQVGSMVQIPGTYTVLNLGLNQGHWLAEIDMDGWKLWVDIATVTEVA